MKINKNYFTTFSFLKCSIQNINLYQCSVPKLAPGQVWQGPAKESKIIFDKDP